jgi:hypothetical protein
MSTTPVCKILDSRLFASLTQLIDIKIQDDIVPPDTKITVKSSNSIVSGGGSGDLSVVIHTFPVTSFVAIQIL